jgi:uncharacterized protein
VFVYSVRFLLHLPSDSLKGKRGILKGLLARARNTFNVAAAEIDLQDVPSRAVIAFVTVAGDRARPRDLMERLEEWIYEERPDVEIAEVDVEER